MSEIKRTLEPFDWTRLHGADLVLNFEDRVRQLASDVPEVYRSEVSVEAFAIKQELFSRLQRLWDIEKSTPDVTPAPR